METRGVSAWKAFEKRGARKQLTPVPGKARCFHGGRMGHYGSMCFVKMAHGPYWKLKNARQPWKQQTHGPIRCWIPPPKKVDNTVSKPVGLRSPRPGERQSAIVEEAARTFGEQAAAMGSALPVPKPLKAPASDIVIIKAPNRDPHTSRLWLRKQAASQRECGRHRRGGRECP
uniref:Uncharacterized protein n=1 Tax=Trypanosoma vivax (strain Y486) TaxID=1055687 RepID=G0TYQ0_TRYVY|nr:hypothetical protein, conserved in T. vivax [Trypanosoma vivax Y486]